MPIKAPSISRALRDVPQAHQQLIREQYERILPVLLRVIRPSDILERNRAWPGVSPINKGATRLLTVSKARIVRRAIREHVEQCSDNPDELWQLLRAYCQHSPIGLVDALPSSLPPLVCDELQACADFHRLAKPPRADAGIYIRKLLDQLADDIDLPRLPTFVARYAFATERRITRWFVGEGPATEHVAKTHRRQNLNQPFPHQCWNIGLARFPFQARLSHRHPALIDWCLLWTTEAYTGQIMGLRSCPDPPTPRDVLLTLRWSIWHYNAPWWPARGAPERLIVPAALNAFDEAAHRALGYIHTQIREDKSTTAGSHNSTLPKSLVDWWQRLSHSSRNQRNSDLTLDELTKLAREEVRDTASETIIATPTPIALAENQVSLPWSDGPAAALLLPSAGFHQISNGVVSLWDIPFDATVSGLADGELVDLRYDPDDARAIYLVAGKGRIFGAPACAFEHQVSWLELAGPSALAA